MSAAGSRSTLGDGSLILVTGASGLIGSTLIPVLEKQGHQVIRAVRTDPRGENEIRWRPLESPEEIPTKEREKFENIDAVVHLAGENIASSRWSDERKRKIRSSRVDATRNLVSLLRQLPSPPSTFITASAVGGYPGEGDEEMTEDSPLG
ncbi:MAG: NAD-dependent epimerase/dehydratase family protein, partial [Planctomycetota bacterium]|nr:NAD-dependent epimerase/dehydratase family protein [Planctomycetota bacterium]